MPSPMIVHQLLQMPIPTFDGSYESRPKFKAMFKDLVDKSPDSPAIKLYHLEKALVGHAAGLIDAKTINEGNYKHAWKILEERFENKRHLIDTHIAGLFNLQKISKENHKELRALVDECSRHVEGLKFLDQEFTGVSELMVIHLLTSALDKETRFLWESTVKNGSMPSYSETIKFLKEHCFILERCNSSPPQTNQQQPSQYGNNSILTKFTSAVTTSKPPILCDFCGKRHLNFTCSEFKTLSIQSRLSKVRNLKMCFNCLRREHRSINCYSNKTCVKCQRRHHTLLHAENQTKHTKSNAMLMFPPLTREPLKQTEAVAPFSDHPTAYRCPSTGPVVQANTAFIEQQYKSNIEHCVAQSDINYHSLLKQIEALIRSSLDTTNPNLH
ncbi:uncharacterized protein LOC129759843 [Uranotaenia lowii]|uniref:uncharacterized protein LOC129759843 n=1 Tax=Uranotaenia lowii TaxID=190385 RepID=UPI002479D28C|nr:uncharacterized protein LOC129759843 [Uranotaenia lowii]